MPRPPPFAPAATPTRSGSATATHRRRRLAHLATYRAFQAWQIAKHLGIPFHLSPELIAGLEEHVVAFADEWRQWGVFPPAIEAPADADDETRLLCAVGHWSP
jgi:hypothetical protein